MKVPWWNGKSIRLNQVSNFYLFRLLDGKSMDKDFKVSKDIRLKAMDILQKRNKL